MTFPDSHRTIFTFRSWLDLLNVVLAFWMYSHSKNLQITSKLMTQGYIYHKLRKTFGKFFRSYSELLSKLGDISFQEYVSKGISHPVFYGDLFYKLRRVKDIPNFISSGSKIVKRLRRRQYDPLIIERTTSSFTTNSLSFRENKMPRMCFDKYTCCIHNEMGFLLDITHCQKN